MEIISSLFLLAAFQAFEETSHVPTCSFILSPAFFSPAVPEDDGDNDGTRNKYSTFFGLYIYIYYMPDVILSSLYILTHKSYYNPMK